MADDQEAIWQQPEVAEGIGEAPERPIGIGPDYRKVGIELNIEVEMRQSEQRDGDRRALQRHGVRLRLDAIEHLLAQGGDIQIGGRFQTGELTDHVIRGGGRLRER